MDACLKCGGYNINGYYPQCRCNDQNKCPACDGCQHIDGELCMNCQWLLDFNKKEVQS